MELENARRHSNRGVAEGQCEKGSVRDAFHDEREAILPGNHPATEKNLDGTVLFDIPAHSY